MTARERGVAPAFKSSTSFAQSSGRHLLVPVLVVDHDDRRAVAGAEALELEQREHPRRIGLARMNAQLAGERFGDALGAGQRARQRAAHLQHVLADLLPEEHDVIGRHVLDVGRRHLQDPGDVPHAVRGQVALLLLHQVERREHRRPLAIGRVFRQQGVEGGAPLRREGERRSLFDQPALALLKALRVVHHQRMETHRSTSPMTTSVEPITAMTSAIMPPMISLGRPWHA